MRTFYLTYRESEKLAPLVREISWSNNIIIMEKYKDDLEREFYIQMAKRYGWTKRNRSINLTRKRINKGKGIKELKTNALSRN